MRPEGYKLFARLLEGYVDEASTSLSLITGSPGGTEVVQKLHKDMKLAHDQDYKSVEKISWSDLKGSYQGAWVIIVGSNGTGAIKSRGDTYDALASTGGEAQQATDSRGGNILDFLKSNIGKLQKFYVGKNTSAVSDKQRKRADAKAGTDSGVSVETLTRKFKPLWQRAITAAIADIKGHVANQIKNDAFEKAQRKLEQVKKLQDLIDMMDAGSDETPGIIKNAINSAVLMAASHHYPEQTGNITKGWGGGGYSAEHSKGPNQLLKDIAEGDQQKLGTVLGFFKRTLISG